MRASSPLTRLFGAVLTARQQFTAYAVLRNVIVKSSTDREISLRIPELAGTLVALSMETSSPGRATWIVTLNKDTLGRSTVNCQPSKSRWLGREARRYSRGTFLAKGLSDFTQENGSRTASICRVSIRAAIYLDKPGKINTAPRPNVSSSFDPRSISLTTKWDDFRKTLEDNRLNAVKRQRDEDVV